MKKILIIGGSAGGSTVATNLRRMDENSQITIIEKGPDVSFANCSLPYYFSGYFSSTEDLIVTSPEKFKSNYNIDVKTLQTVIKINREEKTVDIEDENGKVYKEEYDKLILTTGARARKPEGMAGDNIFVFRNVEDIRNISKYIEENNLEEITIVGNGYIGLELTEAMVDGGKTVNLVGSRDKVLNQVDYDIAQYIHKELVDNGVRLHLGSRAKTYEDGHLILENGKKIKTDIVILAVGVIPNTDLAADAGLEIGETKAIKVNHNFQTNDPDIYALGDVIENFNKINKTPMNLQLAGPAHKEADAVAKHIYGKEIQRRGVIGASMLKVFDYAVGATGLTEANLEKSKIEYDYVYMTGRDRVHGGVPLHMKVIYELPTGRILGAQAIGKDGVDKRIDVVSTMINMGGDLEDLWYNELAYMPDYSTPKDILNLLASMGIKQIQEDHKRVKLSQVRDLVENKAYILDTSSPKAFEKAHLLGSVNIPTVELRNKLNELPKDREIYVLSYSAERILTLSGFKNVYLIDGGIRDISHYEYFQDLVDEREKILSDYLFY